MALVILSTAFANGERVPKRFTGDGEDISPPLTWSGLPAGTKEISLICDDPDAPTPQPWVHWVMYKIAADAGGLPEKVATTEKLTQPPGALQGKNSWNRLGYGGPAPPHGHGTHHYHFKLYALDAPLDLAPGLDKDRLLAAMKGHVLGQGELMGTYER
jgi:Raf kinase inhibitor-like YbhB/YbcL family protein